MPGYCYLFSVDHLIGHAWVVFIDDKWRFVVLEVINKFSIEKESTLEEAVDGL